MNSATSVLATNVSSSCLPSWPLQPAPDHQRNSATLLEPSKVPYDEKGCRTIRLFSKFFSKTLEERQVG